MPAGSAPLPSTALMLGVPATLAGCDEVVLCTPPRADGSADPTVLVAAQLCGITRVFKLGGAQAIAAMAFGTDSIPRCDKLFGPGNAYVTEAKQQVSMLPGRPGDRHARRSVGGAGDRRCRRADPAFVAADLLSQAEHGPDSQVVLLTDAAGLLGRASQRELAAQLATLPRADIAHAGAGSTRAWCWWTRSSTAFAISNAMHPST